MKNTTILAAVIGLLPMMQLMPANAEDAPQYDKSIERAAIQRVASKLGELRGGIANNNDSLFVTKEDMQPPVIIPDTRVMLNKIDALPPMVMGENIDPVVTGGPFKFDANGLPMPHHQDRSMSRPPSLVKDLMNAFKINPYPGDQ